MKIGIVRFSRAEFPLVGFRWHCFGSAPYERPDGYYQKAFVVYFLFFKVTIPYDFHRYSKAFSQ